MSRNKAKEMFTVDDQIRTTEGMECRKDADQITAGDFEFAIGSSDLVLCGGTHNPMAPSLSFLRQITPIFVRQRPVFLILNCHATVFTQQAVGLCQGMHVTAAAGPGGHQPHGADALKDRYAKCLHTGLPKTVTECELAVLKKGLGLQEDR